MSKLVVQLPAINQTGGSTSNDIFENFPIRNFEEITWESYKHLALRSMHSFHFLNNNSEGKIYLGALHIPLTTDYNNNFSPTAFVENFCNQTIGSSIRTYKSNLNESLTGILGFYSNAKFLKLKNDFNVELDKFSHFLQGHPNTIKETFDQLAHELAKIDFNSSIVEISPSNNFKIKLLLPYENLLVINKPMGQLEDLHKNEVIFSLFKEDTLLLSDAVDMFKLATGINEYLLSENNSENN